MITSGSRERVRREMKAHGIEQFFGTVVCEEDIRHKKPHPQGLRLAMRQIRKQAGKCCYVGDRPEDMEMGKRAGVTTVAVPGGFPNSFSVLNCAPDVILPSISGLLDYLKVNR